MYVCTYIHTYNTYIHILVDAGTISVPFRLNKRLTRANSSWLWFGASMLINRQKTNKTYTEFFESKENNGCDCDCDRDRDRDPT